MAEEEEEPDLPVLPKVSWDSHTQTFANTRKRNRTGVSTQLSSNSSDPAVFSSDDDPHVDNYVDGRHRKKRYVGSWFQQRPASSDSTFSEAVGPQPKPNRAFERQQDSGVWMGSDISVDADEAFTTEMEHLSEPRLPQLRNPGGLPSEPLNQLILRNRVEMAVEQGNPDVDLSSLGIANIPNGLLSLLQELVVIPSVDKGVPFEQANPALGVYLSNNRLLRAPGDLFNLEHLTYLSLRNNQLRELPPSIGKLRNLRELNLSLNRFCYLPGELLSLLKFPSTLVSLHVHPNPFYTPEGGLLSHPKSSYEVRTADDEAIRLKYGEAEMFVTPDGRSADELRQWAFNTWPLYSWQAALLARSPVQYSDSRGSVLSRFRLPCEQQDNYTQSEEYEGQHVTIVTEDVSRLSVPDFPGRLSDAPSKSSQVLSLFELALKSASRAAQTWDLASHLPPEAPSMILRSIERVAAQSALNGNSGTLPCSMCGRHITTPIAQWIEWWDISKGQFAPFGATGAPEPLSMNANENAIPFLKRGCSQHCVPKVMAVGQFAPGILRK
ncbi:hypothetical protein F4861DRAFT_469183 [Xylaria intraflava]|nr:hypothetical protein F4861DRAFT_469183 [Xylaria intraflava]